MTSVTIRYAAAIGLVLALIVSGRPPIWAGAAGTSLGQYCAPLEQTSDAHRIYCRQRG